ncbi:winged helix-turn-helix domain-containing protein [Pseudoalteromonas tunicata]|jgi:DNA-binding winged helix-turn-helix (wHTH) protein|uniref:N-terminal winged-HTH domain fused to TolB-like domain n=1 Tax=Pseudoalteromonas tunicata D2 TaxID=87626 RepID=A4CCM5_9GAMM|nr:winged helix-turn-helix domain-containing protein [Pseudoalteromonas tunicata]ATC93819.1 hypothetical protein PTUN_a1146 [Pseudoalteromonas tunicata]AXT29637.1 hypothetical protein D1819_01580 [Pseudoalteromonas tunicata]EAR27318.1 N-terminal winged-HTH domain fused to TolB-like domain [Pseudoalteromonas tunicata D2]
MIIINGKTIDLATGELNQHGETQQLEPKVLAVLTVLYQANGMLVSQQTLLDTVWPNTVVAPNALQRCITQLRKHLADDDKTLIQTFAKRGYRLQVPTTTPRLKTTRSLPKPRSIAMIAVALLIILSLIWLQFSSPQQLLSVSKISPLTYQPSAEQQGSTFNQQLVYVNKTANTSQLIWLNQTSGEERILHQSAHYLGVASFAADGETLLIAEQVFTEEDKESKKCSQIILLAVKNNSDPRIVSPCMSAQISQVYWLNQTKAIFLANNQLSTISLTAPHSQVTLNLTDDIAKIAHFTLSDQQLVISGQTATGQNSLWFLAPHTNDGFTLSHKINLTYDVFSASAAVKLTDNKWLQSHLNTLYVYCDAELCGQTPLATQATITLTAKLNPKTLLATSILKNAAITHRHWQEQQWQAKHILTSEFLERSAQFQPNGQAIAFISNRTGTEQLWLNQNTTAQNPKQLTFADPVHDYIWQADGQALWFLTAKGLYQLTLTAPEKITHHPLNTAISDLMQHVDDKDNNWLLVKTQAGSQLATVNLKTADLTPLNVIDVAWAQALDASRIIFATIKHPYLQLLSDNSTSPITELADIKLQWRFYLRHQQLYIPDKQTRIWRYDFTKRSKVQLGHYDADSFLTTDFQGAPLQMLSDTPKASQTNLVAISLTGLTP